MTLRFFFSSNLYEESRIIFLRYFTVKKHFENANVNKKLKNTVKSFDYILW